MITKTRLGRGWQPGWRVTIPNGLEPIHMNIYDASEISLVPYRDEWHIRVTEPVSKTATGYYVSTDHDEAVNIFNQVCALIGRKKTV